MLSFGFAAGASESGIAVETSVRQKIAARKPFKHARWAGVNGAWSGTNGDVRCSSWVW
jgi:hypothetical protein